MAQIGAEVPRRRHLGKWSLPILLPSLKGLPITRILGLPEGTQTVRMLAGSHLQRLQLLAALSAGFRPQVLGVVELDTLHSSASGPPALQASFLFDGVERLARCLRRWIVSALRLHDVEGMRKTHARTLALRASALSASVPGIRGLPIGILIYFPFVTLSEELLLLCLANAGWKSKIKKEVPLCFKSLVKDGAVS